MKTEDYTYTTILVPNVMNIIFKNIYVWSYFKYILLAFKMDTKREPDKFYTNKVFIPSVSMNYNCFSDM